MQTATDEPGSTRATEKHRLTRIGVLALAAIVVGAGLAHAQQANALSAVYRYRAAIAALLQLKPGMTVAEVGTPSVLGSELLALVGSGGRVISAPPDKVGGTRLEPASVDAVAVLSTLTVVLEPKTMFEGIAKAVKAGGVLLVVDVPQENDGKRIVGLEAEDVVKLATAAGFTREAESGIVPGHYAIRFRKQ